MCGIVCSRNASFAVFIVGYLLFIVAFSTPFWYGLHGAGHDVIMGLWLICTSLWNDCVRIDDDSSTELKWVQAMECIALFIYTAAMVVYCVWMSKSSNYLSRHGAGGVGISAMVLALVAAVFNLIGVGIFSSHYSDDLFDDIEELLDDVYLHGSFACAALMGVMILSNSIITLGVMLCCYRGDNSDSTEVPMTDITVTGTTVIISEPPPVMVAQPMPYGIAAQPVLYPDIAGYPSQKQEPTAPLYDGPPPRYSAVAKEF